ncbi:hypothetical protein J6590_032253 [Homalodisca vitripennis]|nr:hypothetical protein J6590_032253 [Homalodisca vitripennis]
MGPAPGPDKREAPIKDKGLARVLGRAIVPRLTLCLVTRHHHQILVHYELLVIALREHLSHSEITVSYLVSQTSRISSHYLAVGSSDLNLFPPGDVIKSSCPGSCFSLSPARE